MNKTQIEPILVWAFDDAPDEYRNLSANGGDEDWLAFVPAGIAIPLWLTNSCGWSGFGICETEFHHIENGIIAIGCHA